MIEKKGITTPRHHIPYRWGLGKVRFSDGLLVGKAHGRLLVGKKDLHQRMVGRRFSCISCRAVGWEFSYARLIIGR